MVSQGNEILTLGFGHYSCHLATNFFNIQEASFSYNPNFSSGINHDVLFQENSRQSSFFTPRLILVDDEESLGYLSLDGYYKNTRENLQNGSVQLAESVLVNEPKWEKNNFVLDFLKESERLESDAGTCKDFVLKSSYNLDDSVTSWSDYVVTQFDRNTITTLPKYSGYYECYDSFTCFDSGHSMWHKTILCDVIEDKVRHFTEESDNLQGFQILTDGGNGYSGVSSGCSEFLRDEYSKKAIFTVPSIYLDVCKNEDVRTRYRKNCDRIYSLASSFSSYFEFCDIITPMSHLYNPWSKDPTVRSFRSLNFKNDLMYHTSAILAAAFDLFTLPYRLQNVSASMHSLASSIGIYGRRFASVGLNMPLLNEGNGRSFPSLEHLGGRFFESLTPMIDMNPDSIDIQSVTSRGLCKQGLSFKSGCVSSRPEVIENEFKLYLHQFFPRVITQISSCKSVFRVPRTFPKILDNQFNLTGMDYDFGPLAEYVTIGGLHNSREMHQVLSNLYVEAKGVTKKGLAAFGPHDSDLDYEGLFEGLSTAAETYEVNHFL